MNHKLKVSCCKDKLQNIRTYVQEQLKGYTLSEVTVNQLVLAVDEVCSNLMIHSHNCNPHHSIELVITIDAGSSITFEISDEGQGFNFHAYQEPCLEEIIRARKKGGIGLLLVKRIMDRIEYDFDEKTQRNIYRLHKITNATRRTSVSK